MFKRFTTQQLWTLFALSSANVCAVLMINVMAPFFPMEASRRGMSQTVTGFVFSFFGSVQWIGSLICGRYIIPRCGARWTIMVGLMVFGCANILFGFVNHLDEDNLSVFTAICFCNRFFESLGASAFYTSSFTIIMKLYPDDVGTVFVSINIYINEIQYYAIQCKCKCNVVQMQMQ